MAFTVCDRVIESYDKEVDLDKRMDMVLDELEPLSKIDLNELTPILDYNYNFI